MSANNQKHESPALDTPAFLQMLQALHEQTERLEEIWQAIRGSSVDVAAADLRRRYTHIPDHIVEGNARLVSGSPGFGATMALGAASAAQALPLNTSRLGGRIVNIGAANPVTLFLCSAEDQIASGSEPIPQIGLLPNGGWWDLTLGNTLWCGTVIALSALGTSITVAEV